MGSDVLAAPISWAASPELHASARVAPRAVARRLQSDHRSSDATCRLHPVLPTRRRPKALSVSSIERWQYVWGLVEIPPLGECQILHRRKRQPDRQGHVLSLKTRLRTASQGTERSPGWTFSSAARRSRIRSNCHSGDRDLRWRETVPEFDHKLDSLVGEDEALPSGFRTYPASFQHSRASGAPKRSGRVIAARHAGHRQMPRGGLGISGPDGAGHAAAGLGAGPTGRNPHDRVGHRSPLPHKKGGAAD